MRQLRLLLSLLCLVIAVPPAALAQDEPEDDEEKAAAHFAKGRKLYGEGKYKDAIAELIKAFELRPAPPILLNVGRTYEKLGNKKKALEFYRKFLEKARLVDPNRKTVQAMVKRLESETGGPSSTGDASTDTPDAATTGDAGEDPAARRQAQLIHTPVDTAKAKKAITVLAELPPEVEADGVAVYFRKQSELRFRRLGMQLQGDAYVVKIPGRYLTSTSLQYYIEATKKGQRRAVAVAGTARAPHIVVIEGGRAPGSTTGIDIRSPYRTWFWVGAGTSVALLGGGIATAILANDRASAIEEIAKNRPPEQFQARARDWESQGKTFATMSKVFLGVGIAAAGATGVLWYLDRKYVQEKRRELEAGRRGRPIRVVRFSGAPWAGRRGAGFVGRIDF